MVGANINKLLGTVIKTTYTATAADTYEYANIAIPIPTPSKAYEIMATSMYSAAPVTGIILARSNTSLTSGYYILAENTNNTPSVGSNASLSINCMISPYIGDTIYVWVKYGAANKTNPIAVWYREIG